MTDVFKNHKLISDSTGYLHDTPGEAYRELKNWLGEGFPEIYGVFLNQIANQFRDEYGREFEGYELMGGIGGRSGNTFFVHDLAIVDLVLSPVLSKYAETDKGWKWLKSNILDKDVSAECPTFAKRATIPSLIERLREEEMREEAKKYLANLIQMRQGIPSSNEVIFDKLRSEVEGLPVDILLELVQKDLELTDDKIPTNVFVVILLFELIKRGNEEAEKILLGFLDKEEYLKHDGWRYHTLDHFHIITNRTDTQEAIISKLLDNKKWVEAVEKEAFTRGDVQWNFNLWAKEKAKEEGNINFLEEFREKGLRSNLVIKALPEVAKEYPEEVLQLLEGGILTKNVQNEIPDPYVREQIVWVASKLAERQAQLQEPEQEKDRDRFAKGALWILDHFMEDPDPKPFKGAKYDGDPDFDYDKKIREGEDINTITSVRGNISWVLQQLASYKPILPEVYKKTKTLLGDENYYVVQQALIPLSILAANRELLPEKERKDLHRLVFDLLKKHSACLPLASYLLRVFDYYRELDEEDAKTVLEKLGRIDECAGLFIYFAVYREKQYNQKFDSGYFRRLLEKTIRGGNIDVRRKIAWHFWRILDDDISQIEKLEKFVTILSESDYNRQVFGNLDQVIEVVIGGSEHANKAAKWFENSLNKRLGYTKKMVAKDRNFSDWMQYKEIFEGIAKRQPNKFLPLLKKAVEIAETGRVDFYDVKKCFEASKSNSKLDGKRGELDDLWEKVKESYPRADSNWYE